MCVTLLNETFDAARVILSLAFLFYASWSDWKQREVSNRVWIVFAPLALALTALQLAFYSPSTINLLELVLPYVLSFVITSALSVALFYAGAFGGADAKALMCLALALPSPIKLIPSVNLYLPIFPFTVFSNAVLLAAVTAVYAVARNFVWKLRNSAELFAGFEHESVGRKIIVLMTGYKVEPVELERSPHIFPLEDISVKENGESQRVLLTFPKDEDRETILANIASARKEGKIQNGVWVTPGLPMLIFITAGLMLALLLGDLVWILLRIFLAPL